jgi:hypothetical protein
MHGRCSGTTKDGAPCNAPPLPSGFCAWHDPALVEERAAWRARGGEGKSTAARAGRLMPAQLRPVFADLISAMAEVREGTLSAQRGAAMASLAGAAVRVWQAGLVEDRLRDLEAAYDALGRRA